jgi:phage gpG-like protein
LSLVYQFDTKKLEEMTDGMKRRAQDGERQFFKPLAAWLHNAVTKIFKNGGGPEYGIDPWPPISPTIYGRPRYGTSGKTGPSSIVYNESSKPMLNTGGFRNSFGIQDISGDSLKWGSGDPRGALYEYGGWNAADWPARNSRPKRPTLPRLDNPSVLAKVHDIFSRFLVYITQGAGKRK